jgi:Neuraminidase (sialidase)
MIRRFAFSIRHAFGALPLAAAALALPLLLAPALQPQGEAPNPATITPKKLSTDTFTNTTSQHATEVEPDSFSFGSTVVAAFQAGRFYNGGSSDIGFATSTDGGVTWTNGFLPGITNVQGAGNPYDRDSDPSVTYDPRHAVWMISSLPIVESGAEIPAVIVSRSTDGGLSWDNPISVTGNVVSSDKDWIVCDSWTHSPFYGHCYVEWDDFSQGDLIYMSTSTDGGITWGPPLSPAGGTAFGLGGQPVVQPNGTVVVPFEGNGIQAFRSTNGGASWSSAVTVSSVSDHAEAGNLRSSPLPSAAGDGGGKIYVVWQDCRFRFGCSSNDIVLSTSMDGVTWTSPARIPEDSRNSTVDHFIPGIDADKNTSGSTAHLALAYYSYPVSNCTVTTCRLNVNYMSSANGGATWTVTRRIAGGMQLSRLPYTTLGYMVGDYISTSYVKGKAFPVFAVASAKVGGMFNEAIYTITAGLGVDESAPTYSSAGDEPVPNAKSDHGPRKEQSERGRKLPPATR